MIVDVGNLTSLVSAETEMIGSDVVTIVDVGVAVGWVISKRAIKEGGRDQKTKDEVFREETLKTLANTIEPPSSSGQSKSAPGHP